MDFGAPRIISLLERALQEDHALADTTARLTVSEGRYHQVRRMFAALGNHVESLHRAQMGDLTLRDLPSGKWRILTPAERDGLLKSV